MEGKYTLAETKFYTLQFLRYGPDKILKVKVTKEWAKVKSRPHHDVAHLHYPTNIPTKHQLPPPYGFQDIDQTRFLRSMSLWQGPRSQSRSCYDVYLKPLTYVPTTFNTLRILRYSLGRI